MTLRADRKHFAGDDLLIRATADSSLVGSRVLCTIKRLQADADAAAIAQLDSDDPPTDLADGSITISGSSVRAWFSSPQTESWPIADLSYDVQQVTASGEVYTLARGLLRMRRRPTRTRTTAPPGPLEILGSARVAFWLAREHWTAASWVDETNGLNATQADASKQFVRDGDLVRADGVNDVMFGTLASPLLAGSRPSAFVVCTPAFTTGTRVFLQVRGATQAALSLGSVSGRYVAVFQKAAAAVYSYRAGVGSVVLQPVRLEQHYPAALTDRFFVDEVEVHDAFTGTAATDAIAETCGDVYIANNNTSTAAGGPAISDMVVTRDELTADELAAMRRWMYYRATGVVLCSRCAQTTGCSAARACASSPPRKAGSRARPSA